MHPSDFIKENNKQTNKQQGEWGKWLGYATDLYDIRRTERVE